MTVPQTSAPNPSPLSLLAVSEELKSVEHPRIALWCAAVAASIGVLVLAGWTFDSEALRALGPATSGAMNPTVAALFVLCAAALWLLSRPNDLRASAGLHAIALLILSVGLVRLAAASALSTVTVDGMLFGKAMHATPDGRQNSMAPNTAVNFILISIALLATSRRTSRMAVIAQALAGLVLLSSGVAFAAYLFQSGWFETIGAFNRMARPSAIAFAALSVGAMALQGPRSLLAVLLSEGPGGALARSLLPAGLLVPPLFGWLKLLTERAAIMAPDVANMLFVIVVAVVFVVLICWNAVQLHESHLERLRAEEALRESEVRFRLLAENGSDVVTMHDLSGRVTYVSPSCERVLGFLPEELQRMTPFAIVHPDDGEKLRRHIDALIRGEPVTAISCRMLHKSGRHVWLETMWRSIASHDGKIVRLQASARDITERKEYERQLEEAQRKLTVQQDRLMDANMRLEALATQDGLTGLKNRRAFEERTRDEIARARRAGRPMSVMLLDIDHFKQFNDSFGHPRGDEVLREVARHITRSLRDTDYAARYGGEEFAILLPDTDREGAHQLGERLRASIEQGQWIDRPITVSLGVGSIAPEVTVLESLIEHADRALYRSKQNGRNLVSA
ncbi:MAG: diguanylate cyclase [Gemmatimonadaceae bacterium]